MSKGACKRGFLLKQTKDGKQWKKRFCEVNGSFLAIYNNIKLEQMIAMVDLTMVYEIYLTDFNQFYVIDKVMVDAINENNLKINTATGGYLIHIELNENGSKLFTLRAPCWEEGVFWLELLCNTRDKAKRGCSFSSDVSFVSEKETVLSGNYTSTIPSSFITETVVNLPNGDKAKKYIFSPTSQNENQPLSVQLEKEEETIMPLKDSELYESTDNALVEDNRKDNLHHSIINEVEPLEECIVRENSPLKAFAKISHWNQDHAIPNAGEMFSVLLKEELEKEEGKPHNHISTDSLEALNNQDLSISSAKVEESAQKSPMNKSTLAAADDDNASIIPTPIMKPIRRRRRRIVDSDDEFDTSVNSVETVTSRKTPLPTKVLDRANVEIITPDEFDSVSFVVSPDQSPVQSPIMCQSSPEVALEMNEDMEKVVLTQATPVKLDVTISSKTNFMSPKIVQFCPPKTPGTAVVSPEGSPAEQIVTTAAHAVAAEAIATPIFCEPFSPKMFKSESWSIEEKVELSNTDLPFRVEKSPRNDYQRLIFLIGSILSLLLVYLSAAYIAQGISSSGRDRGVYSDPFDANNLLNQPSMKALTMDPKIQIETELTLSIHDESETSRVSVVFDEEESQQSNLQEGSVSLSHHVIVTKDNKSQSPVTNMLFPSIRMTARRFVHILVSFIQRPFRLFQNLLNLNKFPTYDMSAQYV